MSLQDVSVDHLTCCKCAQGRHARQCSVVYQYDSKPPAVSQKHKTRSSTRGSTRRSTQETNWKACVCYKTLLTSVLNPFHLVCMSHHVITKTGTRPHQAQDQFRLHLSFLVAFCVQCCVVLYCIMMHMWWCWIFVSKVVSQATVQRET